MSMLRRLLALVLLAVFALPLASPLLALGPGGDAGLPACCRREGKHHCAMTAAERSRLSAGKSADPAFRTPEIRCPHCPATLQTASRQDLHALPAAERDLLPPGTHDHSLAQAVVWRRNARKRTRHNRGPPTNFLLLA